MNKYRYNNHIYIYIYIYITKDSMDTKSVVLGDCQFLAYAIVRSMLS